MEDAIVTRELNKTFGTFRALTEINLSLPSGSILGLVGPNGAGKSTLMKTLLGLYLMSSGNARVLGYDVRFQSQQIRASAGYVPDRLPFSFETALDLVAGFGYLHGFSRPESKRRAREVLEAFGAYGYREKRYRDLSDGMRKRVILALASVHDPSIYFLDEPTANLDVAGVQTLTTLIKRQIARGVPMVIATHRAKFIQKVCDRVAVLVQGKLLFHGSIEEFLDLMLRGDMLLANASLNNVEIKPELVDRLALKALGGFTLVPREQWEDFQKITGIDLEKLKAKPEPRSLSYALAKCYNLGVPQQDRAKIFR